VCWFSHVVALSEIQSFATWNWLMSISATSLCVSAVPRTDPPAGHAGRACILLSSRRACVLALLVVHDAWRYGCVALCGLV
jgi:hypothetical protein